MTASWIDTKLKFYATLTCKDPLVMKRRKNRLIDIRTRLAVTVLNIASRSDFKPDFRSLSSTKKTKSPIRLCQIIHLQANRYALSIFSFGKLVKKQLRHTTSFMSIRRQFWHFNIGSKNANGKKYDSAYVSQSRNPNTNFDFENDVKWTFSIALLNFKIYFGQPG